jgi:hypothetical protein
LWRAFLAALHVAPRSRAHLYADSETTRRRPFD